MTREELKKHYKKQIEMCEMWAKAKGEKPSGKVYEEHKMILELLEQESCEDCISRAQALSDYADWYGYGYRDNTFYKHLEDMPSVTPQPKTGQWISAKVGKLFPSNDFKCSECGNILDFNGVNGGRGDANYCPNCGAKMKEVD